MMTIRIPEVASAAAAAAADGSRFKRVAAAFNEAYFRVRLCQSSGSEHFSPDEGDKNAADLSDLVNSFIEKDFRRPFFLEEGHEDKENNIQQEAMTMNECSKAEEEEEGEAAAPLESNIHNCSIIIHSSETKEILQNLLLNHNNNNNNNNVADNDDEVRQMIRAEVELACGGIVDVGEKYHSSLQGFKRRLMSSLRDRGFDAGLCKSRWERFGRHPAGEYEYVDVNGEGNRYIVEVNLGGEFDIARPTSTYAALLDVFPHVFVGKAEELRQVVRLMCGAIRESMKQMGLHVPPWRRSGYMKAKWFGYYKRTVSEKPTSKPRQAAAAAADINNNTVVAESSVGFDFEAILRTPPRVRVVNCCRDDFANKVGLKVSRLTAAFGGN